jgi:hypothetical protein
MSTCPAHGEAIHLEIIEIALPIQASSGGDEPPDAPYTPPPYNNANAIFGEHP